MEQRQSSSNQLSVNDKDGCLSNIMDEDQEITSLDVPKDIFRMIYRLVYEQSPYLLSVNDNDDKCKLYHPVFENSYYADFKRFGRISSSNFGWLLMNEDNCHLAFLNPFTSERVDVPKINYQAETAKFDIFYFSSPPVSSDCTIIAMKNANFSEIGIIKRGDEDWTLNLKKSYYDFKTMFCNPVFYKDCFYFAGDKKRIGVFDINANDWKVIGPQNIKVSDIKANDRKVIGLHKPYDKSYLYNPLAIVKYNGGLLVVYETLQHQQIYAATFDLSTLQWTEISCLEDDKVLYISPGASYLETVVAKGMGNRIYFPKFYEGSGVYYSFATNKYHSNDGRYCSETPYGLVEPKFCTWIKSNNSMTMVTAKSDLGSNIIKWTDRR